MTRESGSSSKGTVQFASSGSVTRHTEVTPKTAKRRLSPDRPQPARNELMTRWGSTESATILDMQVHIDGQNLIAKG